MDVKGFVIPPGLAETVRNARRVVVLTGAGVSAESGLPTFREAQTGLWAQYRPQDLATPEAFRQNPRLVWEWYAWRRELVERAAPNAGHRALAALERRVPEMTLVTQNVDGLHQMAGSGRVLELHGNIRRSKCFVENVVIDSWPSTDEVPPHCPRCGDLLRPDVIWFGECLLESTLAEAIQKTRECDLFLSLGTSGVVEPAASLPYLAAEQGATVLFVNLEVPTGYADPIYTINGPTGEVLPALVQAAWPE